MQVTTIISRGGNTNNNLDFKIVKVEHNTMNPESFQITSLQNAMSGYYTFCEGLVEDGAELSSEMIIPHPLCLALHKGSFEMIKLLINHGANVNEAFGDFYPMFYALDNKKCQVNVVKLGIEAGFPKNGVINCITKETSLHMAVRLGHIHIVKYLLSISVDHNAVAVDGVTPLHVAVQKGNSATVDLLVKFGRANVNIWNKENNYTPIIFAIATGNCEIVSQLISLGADVYHATPDNDSLMPLQFAARIGQLKITQLLIEKGVDVNKQNPNTGEIALHSVAKAKALTLRNKIAQNCIVEVLIKSGSDVTMRQKGGVTPLQEAVSCGNFDIAKLLIKNGSELNNTIGNNQSGCTTFHLISKTANMELIKLALEYGADCLMRNIKGLYPIHYVLIPSLKGSTVRFPMREIEPGSVLELDICKEYWKEGFPFDLTFNLGQLTSGKCQAPSYVLSLVEKQLMLFNGVKAKSIRHIMKALSHGAEVNSCSTDIPHPLHYIISSKDDGTILELFLSKGSVVNVVNNCGLSPLHVAAEVGSVTCCLLLLEYGAVYNGTSEKCSKTPLCLAKEYENTEVVTLLETVDKYFKGVKNKHLIKQLNPEMKIFNAVMKCSRDDGLTLLATACNYGSKENVERLVKLRFQCCIDNKYL